MSADHPTPTPQRRRSTRTRRWAGIAGAGVLATVLGLGGINAAASPLVPTRAGSAAVSLVDWGEPGDGWSAYGQQQPDSQGSAGSSTGAVDSDPATAAESAGVVLIDTVLGSSGAAAGTGIVLTADGEVLTNYHVVEGSTSITVTVAATGRTYRATVVGHDQTHDVALLQLKDASGLTVAAIDDDTLSTGDAVTAVGNAGGTGSLTAADGRVTALGASITTASEATSAGESLRGLIMTDADVVAGDSGGPLLDAEHEVVGIDTAASSGTEIDGYAVPIDQALGIVKQILAGDRSSTVAVGAKAYLGVQISAGYADPGYGGYAAGDSGYASGNGAPVAGVEDGTAAAGAGLAAGDTITAVDSTAVTSADDLTTALAGHASGDQVRISWTDASGASHTAVVTLGSSPVA